MYRSKVISQRLAIIVHFTCSAAEYSFKLYGFYVSNSNPFVGWSYITASDYSLALIIHMKIQTQNQTNKLNVQLLQH
jgi:hypothetical protein